MREVKTFGSDCTNSNFLLGMLCGAAVGAAVGLLLAPKTGAELRNQLYESTGRLRRSAVTGYAAAVETVSNTVDGVVERGKMAAQQGQEAYDNVRRSAANGVHNVAKAATDRL